MKCQHRLPQQGSGPPSAPSAAHQNTAAGDAQACARPSDSFSLSALPTWHNLRLMGPAVTRCLQKQPASIRACAIWGTRNVLSNSTLSSQAAVAASASGPAGHACRGCMAAQACTCTHTPPGECWPPLAGGGACGGSPFRLPSCTRAAGDLTSAVCRSKCSSMHACHPRTLTGTRHTCHVPYTLRESFRDACEAAFGES